jgi:hypothetical protein
MTATPSGTESSLPLVDLGHHPSAFQVPQWMLADTSVQLNAALLCIYSAAGADDA